MPLALLGLIISLAIWDLFKFCSDNWKFDGYPVFRQVLVRIVQCGKFSYLPDMSAFNKIICCGLLFIIIYSCHYNKLFYFQF